MARRFERNLENPERRIEIEGEFSQTNNIEESLENPYEDDFDKKIDRAKLQQIMELKKELETLEIDEIGK